MTTPCSVLSGLRAPHRVAAAEAAVAGAVAHGDVAAAVARGGVAHHVLQMVAQLGGAVVAVAVAIAIPTAAFGYDGELGLEPFHRRALQRSAVDPKRGLIGLHLDVVGFAEILHP